MIYFLFLSYQAQRGHEQWKSDCLWPHQALWLVPPGRLGGGQRRDLKKYKRIINGCAIWGQRLWDSTLTMRCSQIGEEILDWLEVPPMPQKCQNFGA